MDDRELRKSVRRMQRTFAHQIRGGLYRGTWADVLYDNPLVFVDRIALPQSRGYVWGKATFVDSARNAEGVMIGAVIRDDVARIELTWNYLYREEVQLLGSLPFISDVSFYYPPAGGFVTREMYTSDFTGGTPFVGGQPNGSLDEYGLPPGHDNLRLALIEV